MFREWFRQNGLPELKRGFFPDINDRSAWNGVEEFIRNDYLKNAEKYRGFDWPPLKASDFRRFHTDGNRQCYEKPHFERRFALQTLVIAQCLLGKEDDTYKDDIINGIIAVCEESFWGVSAHSGLQDIDAPYGKMTVQNRLYPVIDLFAAETGALMSWTMYLLSDCFGELSEQIWERVRYEVKSRLLEPFQRENFYWWMGFRGTHINNWNPWIVSNILSCALLCEDSTKRLENELWKIFICLDNYVDSLPEDGGCDEGPGYWRVAGGALFQSLYQLYRASGGGIDFFREPKIKRIFHYIADVHIDGSYFFNFADGSHIADRGSLRFIVALCGKYTGDRALSAMGMSMLEESRKDPAIYRPERDYCLKGILEKLFEKLPDAGEPVSERDVYLPDLQLVRMREHTRSSDGLIIGAKGGHNAESHNHNDVGSFIVYADGKPALIDPGVETYTAQTFSPKRYELWTMQSCWHNLMTVNGEKQRAGKCFCAENAKLEVCGETSEFSVSLQKAYPESAGLEALCRSIRLDRAAGSLAVSDSYIFNSDKNTVEQYFISCVRPILSDGAVKLDLGGSGIILIFDSTVFSAAVEERQMTDPKLREEWGDSIYRVVLKAETGREFSPVYKIAKI